MKTFKEFLLELSFDAKTIIWKIRGLSDPIIAHLIKLYMFPNSTYRDHWINEVSIWLGNIADYNVKHYRRKLSEETYFKLLFEELLEDISDATKKSKIVNTKKRYPDEKTNIEVEDFDKMRDGIRSFYKEVCESIATDTFDIDIKPLLEKHFKR